MLYEDNVDRHKASALTGFVSAERKFAPGTHTTGNAEAQMPACSIMPQGGECGTVSPGRVTEQMKTILVVAPHPELADAMRAGLNPEQYRTIHRANPEEAEPMLAHGLADVCVLDMELTGVQGIWVVEKLQRRAPRCPILVYTGARAVDWEEEAYLKGVRHVLTKPFRARLLETVLEGLLSRSQATAPTPAPRQFDTTFFGSQSGLATTNVTHSMSATPANNLQNLGVLRDFSAILTHSLNAEALLRQFLLMIRELTGVNRAAIFLRSPSPALLGGNPAEDSTHLGAACAIGLASHLLQNVRLSFNSGIAGQVSRLGRILRRSSAEAADLETQREFELLGAQVAIPLLDRERVLGVAVFDTRVTGEPLVNAELEMIFHLLEQVGLAVKNIWLHDQVASNHSMLSDVMRELSSACVVVSRDLTVLHANRMARKYFGQTGGRAGELDFSDIPPALGSKVFQVLKTGSALAPFRYTPENEPGTVYQVTISPVHHSDSAVPASALLIVEDRTQTEQLQRLEVEAKNLRLVRSMAERLAAEIGNAMVPIAVHQQLIAERFKDPEFRAALDKALAEGVKRVDRLVHQMRYLAGNVASSGEAISVGTLVEEAFQEAKKYLTGKSGKLNNECREQPVVVSGDRSALKHALSEVILNALQSNPASPQVAVRCVDAGMGSAVNIEVSDNGPGFTPEAQKEASTPFFTTRIPGVGLGLAVTRKIVETHHGKLEIPPPQPGQPGIVRVSLPSEMVAAQH
jgi:signal transduction histidine kinase/CheY-like chemotaxis protein